MNLCLKKRKKDSSEQVTESKPTKRPWYSWLLDNMLLVANVIVVALYLIGHLSKGIHPADFILPAYLGLGFPYLLLVVILFAIVWVIRMKWYFVFSLGALFFTVDSLKETFPLNSQEPAPDDCLKVMSYNVHLFNFYTEKSRNNVLKYISQVDADVICMQEFGYNTNKKKPYLREEEIIEVLSEKYPYFHVEINELETHRTFGVATFSKYPIIREENIEYKSTFNSSIISTIIYKGRAIKVFNCHLESNKLTENDKTLLRELGKNFETDKVNEVAKHLSKKMQPSYLLRADQADTISRLVEITKEPIILCGDFNDVPVSYTYHLMKGDKLIDSFEECGRGYGYTFSELPFWFRIDHILHSKGIQSYEFKVDHVPYSDHLPLFCKLKMNIEQKNE